MNANELRVTNIVSYEGKEMSIAMIGISKVSLFKKNGFLHDANLDEINPIPITEEWLLKFGGEIEGNGYNDICIVFPNNKNSRLSMKDDFIQWTTHHSPHADFQHIKYVHQLQNLYFALTNQELKINKSA